MKKNTKLMAMILIMIILFINTSLVNAEDVELDAFSLSEEKTQQELNSQTKTGWLLDESNWYYLDEFGEIKIGWLNLNNTWYYLDAFGRMQTGWLDLGDSWYYLDTSGKMQTGWLDLSDGWYYLDASGKMQSSWLDLSDSWYYLDASGRMQSGWLDLSDGWYYLDASGKMQTSWLELSDSWYYLDVSGKMQTGWLELSDSWYYLDASGKMQTGWIQLKNAWYYLNEAGRMVTNALMGSWHVTGSGKANFIPNLDLQKFNSYQKEVLDLVNIEREKNGFLKLRLNQQLADVATVKSQDMINEDYFDHNSPTYGSPFDMMESFGITFYAAGENIAAGYGSPKSVMNGWMRSPGHKSNILDPDFTEIGIGIAISEGTLYWTQMFI